MNARYPSSWISLCWLHCAEDLRNWMSEMRDGHYIQTIITTTSAKSIRYTIYSYITWARESNRNVLIILTKWRFQFVDCSSLYDNNQTELLYHFVNWFLFWLWWTSNSWLAECSVRPEVKLIGQIILQFLCKHSQNGDPESTRICPELIPPDFRPIILCPLQFDQ